MIEEDGSYFVELELFGHRVRHAIANVCYPVFSIAIGSLKVCTSNVIIDGGQLKSITITVQGCIGTKIGPISVEKCWNLYSGSISFFHLNDDKDAAGVLMGFDKIISGYNDIMYIERSDSNDVDPSTVVD